MSVLTEVRLRVVRRVNLGDYEHVELEASSVVGRDSDDDTAEGLRERVLSEVSAILQDAYKEHVPARRMGAVKGDARRDDDRLPRGEYFLVGYGERADDVSGFVLGPESLEQCEAYVPTEDEARGADAFIVQHKKSGRRVAIAEWDWRRSRWCDV